MEGHEVLDAITHAVRAVERRSEGLAAIADRHSAASKAALTKMTKRSGDLALMVARFTVRDWPGSR